MPETSDDLTPSTAYLDAMRRATARRQRDAARGAPGAAGPDGAYPGQESLWAAARARGEALRPLLKKVALDLHAHPETAFEERRSARLLVDALAGHGAAAELGAHGVETAFRSEYTTPGYLPDRDTTVAVMAEYDALPEIGHACGHNVIAAAGLGAFLAARDALAGAHRAAPSPAPRGRLVLLGTPAEEGHTGKEYLIRAGALNGVDAAVMVHPFGYDIAEHAWVGRRTLDVTFSGVAAHASSQPYMGRNALDAASLAYQAIGLWRQEMPPSDRVHAIIEEGGTRPSVIPERARMSIYVRSLLPDALRDLSRRVDDIVTGAALMAGVRVEREWDRHPASLPVRNSGPLAARWSATQRARGRDPLPAGVVPDALAASTDFGNVSHLIPGLHPMVKVSPENVALHTAEFAEYTNTDGAVDTAVDSAVGLAQVAIDYLGDEDLREEAAAEFRAAGGPQRVAEILGETES